VARVGPAGLASPVPIDSSHDTTAFACGRDVLDAWLAANALKSEGQTARTYVVCEGAAVVAYYCLSTGSVVRAAAPGKIRRNVPDPVPVMIIGRLAVSLPYHGRGVGGAMLRDAFRRILRASEIVGCRAVVVHAIDREAAEFYSRYGFSEFPGGSLTMYLSLETLRRAL